MKARVMMLCLVLVTWGANAQHDHASQGDDQSKVTFKDAKLGAAYAHYLHVKDALVASKSDEAKRGASELQKALKEVKGSAKAAEATTKLIDASDLTLQRKAFSDLSDEMATLVKGGKLSMGSVYVAYCPMANNNEGANWLSNDKEIKNPYFGDKMLRCGSVMETIQ
jgi:hypothetical protein